MHVNDVIVISALAGFLVPRFLVFPLANPSNFPHCSRIPIEYQLLHFFIIAPIFKYRYIIYRDKDNLLIQILTVCRDEEQTSDADS